MIALLVMTDGRFELLDKTIRSARSNLHGPITRKLIHDDTGDGLYRVDLIKRFSDFEVIGQRTRQGFGGAIRFAWEYLQATTFDERFVFHLEDDFTFNRAVYLDDMAATLVRCQWLVQLALRRQPWNHEERAAGGIVEQHPTDYADAGYEDWRWLEHRRFFTTNPSLYRMALTERGWPDVKHSEGVFSAAVFEDPAARSAFWGSRDSGEWVHHIGTERAGVNY